MRVVCDISHDRPWISLWIKWISNELDITIHVIVSQLSGYCDVINNQLWHHQQSINPASEAQGGCVKIVLLSYLSSLCHVRNKIMYVFLWGTVSALTRVLLWCLFLSLLRKSGNKQQNNPRVSTETGCHLSTYISLYLSCMKACPVVLVSIGAVSCETYDCKVLMQCKDSGSVKFKLRSWFLLWVRFELK